MKVMDGIELPSTPRGQRLAPVAASGAGSDAATVSMSPQAEGWFPAVASYGTGRVTITI